LFLCMSYSSRRPRALPSFPTRRSSDLRSLPPEEALLFGRDDGDRIPAVVQTALELIIDGKLRADPRGVQFFARYRQKPGMDRGRSEEHTSELQSRVDLVCRLLLEKKKT